MTKFEKLTERLAKAERAARDIRAQYEAERLKTIRTVAISQNGATWTLEHGDRVFKAKKNRYGRLTVSNGHTKEVIDRDWCFGGIHNLRLAIAIGNI